MISQHSTGGEYGNPALAGCILFQLGTDHENVLLCQSQQALRWRLQLSVFVYMMTRMTITDTRLNVGVHEVDFQEGRHVERRAQHTASREPPRLSFPLQQGLGPTDCYLQPCSLATVRHLHLLQVQQFAICNETRFGTRHLTGCQTRRGS